MIIIEPHDPSWSETFERLGSELRQALGDLALAIHHIGSTSVPGLAAKDVIDIQLTVADLDCPIDAALEGLGFEGRPDLKMDHPSPGMHRPDDELQKRVFTLREPRTNLHVRVAGRFNQLYPLLCRDYLRATPAAAAAYAQVKRQLAAYFPNDSEAYYAVKDPVFDLIMAGARQWAASSGWQEPPSDA